MFKQVTALFIFMVFSLSVLNSVSEATSLHGENEISVMIIDNVKYSTLVFSSDSMDCKNNCGNHEDEHCIHHCSGIHNIFSQNQLLTVDSPSIADENKLWSYSVIYTPPVLDPALKPPLFI